VSSSHVANDIYLPLQTAMSYVKDSVLTQFAFLLLYSALDSPQFARVTAHDFFWGYEDPLYKLARKITTLSQHTPHDRFGIFVQVATAVYIAQGSFYHTSHLIIYINGKSYHQQLLFITITKNVINVGDSKLLSGFPWPVIFKPETTK
jgi:hypothetical protein